MIIGSNKKLLKIDTPDAPKPQFRIGSEDVKLVSDVKYLRVQVDQELKWTNHLTTVTNKTPTKQYLPPKFGRALFQILLPGLG